MRKVILNMKESEKYEVIKKLVETDGNKKAASVKLGCSLRHINRLIIRYKEKGKEGFLHLNKGKSPPNKFNKEIKDKVIFKYLTEYKDANITHYSEILLEDEGLKISRETIRLWLIESNEVSPKTHKITRKRIAQRIKDELRSSKSIKRTNLLKEKIEELDRSSVHPRRQRSKYFGEMIQMDASEYNWINGRKWHLHLAIDDASGSVVGAYFDYQETLNGYYNVLSQILSKYGIPAMFYTDKRTVFEYTSRKRAFDDEDTFTQFSFACHKLGIDIKTTSVPEAKGRIERLNQSFQSRLPVELRRANVVTIEEANEFLKSYLEKYNNHFALQFNTTKSVFDGQLSNEDINNRLSIISTRTIDQGCTIRFRNKRYIPINENSKEIYFKEGTKVLVIETFDKRLIINVSDVLYNIKEIEINKEFSEEFDIKKERKEVIKKPAVPVKTPWRTDDFLGFLAKQKHRQEYRQSLC